MAPKWCSLVPGWVDFGIRSWSYKQWVHRLYSLLAPKWLNFAFQRPVSYCMTLSDQILCPWCNTGGEVSPQAESWKTPTLEPLRSKHSWLSGKKEGAFKNTKIKCHFKFHFVTVPKLLWIRPNESSLKEWEGGTSSLAGIGKRSAWKVFRNGKRP